MTVPDQLSLIDLEEPVRTTAERVEAALLIALEASDRTGMDAQRAKAVLRVLIDACGSSEAAVKSFDAAVDVERQRLRVAS